MILNGAEVVISMLQCHGISIVAGISGLRELLLVNMRPTVCPNRLYRTPGLDLRVYFDRVWSLTNPLRKGFSPARILRGGASARSGLWLFPAVDRRLA